MSWRIVAITSRAKLDYKMNYLVVRTSEETKRININEISVLIIESTGVSLTAYLLSELIKSKVYVLFCDEKRLPQCELLPLYGCFDTSLKVRNQISWTKSAKGNIWAEIVRTKIIGQASVFSYSNQEEKAQQLLGYASEIEPYDSTNREGHAAKVYFNALFGNDFSRSQECNTNAALNYGYSIFLSAIAREIVVSGYINQIGIYHNNVHNPLNFACDLVEPFRPYVDNKVAHMDLAQFQHDEKMQLVNLLNLQVKIDGQLQYMLFAIKTYARSVFDALNENDISKLKFPSYEL